MEQGWTVGERVGWVERGKRVKRNWDRCNGRNNLKM